MRNVVIFRFAEDGEMTCHVAGEDVRVFMVDERCPGDRVYEWLSRSGADEIRAILRDDPIGSSADERHEAIKHRILRAIDGKRHLEVVE